MAKKTTPPPSFLQRIISVFDKFEPIPILIFIFSTFGAFHQVYALYKIGYPYIRFFSSTQLLSDSIAFLLILILKVAYPFILGGVASLLIYRIFNKKKEFIFKYSVYIIYVLCFIYTISMHYLNLTQDYASLILSAYGYQLITNIYGIMNVHKVEENESSDESKIPEWKLYIFFILTFIMFIYTPLSGGYSSFVNNTLLSNEFENFNKIHSIYKNKGVRDSILYFNDNYIFVEIKKDSIYPDKKNPKKLWKKQIRKIEILKFDKFFE